MHASGVQSGGRLAREPGPSDPAHVRHPHRVRRTRPTSDTRPTSARRARWPLTIAVDALAQQLLLLLGLGFLAANLRIGRDLLRFRRARRDALLVWPQPRPRFHRFSLLLGIIQALLLASLVLLKRPAPQIFGLAMMLIYFLCATPLSLRIDRGFYGAGVWSDRGFVPWSHISGVSWRENPVTLVLLSPMRHTATLLHVPSRLYGEARQVLRERIRVHGFHGDHAGLELREHDDREDV